jgi:hypothetical protein
VQRVRYVPDTVRGRQGEPWAAYASSTDNTTGDGWVSIAARDYGDDELDFIGFSHKQAKRGDR